MIAWHNDRHETRTTLFQMKRPIVVLTFACFANLLFAQAPNTIYGFAIGDWRDGPIVTISPLFETTEAFTTPQLIARVKKEYKEFANITDIDVQRFVTIEEGELSRITLKGKYGVRKLQVNMVEAPEPIKNSDMPAPKEK
jgi:hypothetical protein